MGRVETTRERSRNNNGPTTYANRVSSYIKCPVRVHAMTVREYGKSPTVEQIEKMQSDHKRRADNFARETYTDNYNPDNDNGQPWTVNKFAAPKPTRYVDGPAYTPVHIVLAELKPPPKEAFKTSAKALVAAVGQAFGYKYEDMIGKSRVTQLVAARAVVSKLLQERNPAVYSLNTISKILGRSDHTVTRNLLNNYDHRVKRFPQMLTVYHMMGGNDAA